MEVLLVNFHVLGEIKDPFREDRYLHIGRAGITGARGELLDEFLFAFCVQGSA